jgi:hypothetical protein
MNVIASSAEKLSIPLVNQHNAFDNAGRSLGLRHALNLPIAKRYTTEKRLVWKGQSGSNPIGASARIPGARRPISGRWTPHWALAGGFERPFPDS